MARKLMTLTSFRAIHVDGLEEEAIREKEYLYQVTRYDTAGNILSEETFTREGEREHKSGYTYDDQGRVTEEILLEAEDFVSEHRTIEYDEQGRRWKEKLHYLDSSYDETVWLYDDRGRVIAKEITDSEGQAGNRTIYSYEGDLLIEEKEVDKEDELVFRRVYEYDGQGNLVSEKTEGDDSSETRYEYDDNGHRTLMKVYDSLGRLIERSWYVRDEHGKVVELTEENVVGKEIQQLTYDPFGNVILQESVRENGELLSRIKRIYEGETLLTTHVHYESWGQRPAQDYRIRFEYEYGPSEEA